MVYNSEEVTKTDVFTLCESLDYIAETIEERSKKTEQCLKSISEILSVIAMNLNDMPGTKKS